MSSSFDNETVYQGIFSDGETAGSQKVLVAFGERRLELRTPDGELIVQWIYHEITTIDHLHPGEATQIGIEDQPGARLYIDNEDFAGELISHLPHMSRPCRQPARLYSFAGHRCCADEPDWRYLGGRLFHPAGDCQNDPGQCAQGHGASGRGRAEWRQNCLCKR